MADYYADSSVLVKRHVRETGTDWLRGLVNPAGFARRFIFGLQCGAR